MSNITAIIVDDEESARDVLENLLGRFCPSVQLLDKCNSVEQAIASIAKHAPQLVFLDIEMPNYAGFEIVNFFEKIDFEIVFVTAYDQYAIKAFEVSAVDYLLKPIDIERLQAAVAKACNSIDLKATAERMALLGNTLQSKEIRSIALAENGQQHIVALENIIAIEAQESYCFVHTFGKKIMVSKNLKHFETMLEAIPTFIRVHKSWIVNTQHIVSYSKSMLVIQMAQGVSAKLSKYKKAEFEQLFT